ncbi:hypothetical protein Bpfe_031113 [Biomphalaria pfeifferi]|uniref:Uncharacterized protein n=1 Tax=Biomphalaria pfeifferi TaxID=112525 RepID=A0AAD8ANC9_BIOPF|nr:hypothetical protein Bpfe_031113 [Biomphalaria pfeifferi]
MPGQYRRTWIRALAQADHRPLEFEVVSLHQMIPGQLLMKLGSRKAPTWVPDMGERITSTINRLIQQHKPQAVVLAAPESLACLGLAPEHATLHNLRGSVYWRMGIPHLVTLPISAWNTMVTQKDIGAANYGFESQESLANKGRENGTVHQAGDGGVAGSAAAIIRGDKSAAASKAVVPDSSAGDKVRSGSSGSDSEGGRRPAFALGAIDSIPDGNTNGVDSRSKSADSGRGDSTEYALQGSEVRVFYSSPGVDEPYGKTLPAAGARFRMAGSSQTAGQPVGNGQGIEQSAISETEESRSESGAAGHRLDRAGNAYDGHVHAIERECPTPVDSHDGVHRDRQSVADSDPDSERTADVDAGTDSDDEGDEGAIDSADDADGVDVSADPGAEDSGESGTVSSIDDDEEVDRFFYEPVLSPVGRFVITADLMKLKRILIDGKQSQGPANPLVLNWQD